MTIIKGIAIVAAVYVGVALLLEGLIVVVRPDMEGGVLPERDRVSKSYAMGFILRLVCGFAPSKFLRLDPRPADG